MFHKVSTIRKNTGRVLFMLSVVLVIMGCFFTAEQCYAADGKAEISITDKEFYTNGNEVDIYDIEDEQLYQDYFDASIVKQPRDENSTLVAIVFAEVETPVDGEENAFYFERYTSEIYYLSSGYTIYGGGREADCVTASLENRFRIHSGDIDTIVVGGKNGNIAHYGSSWPSVHIYGGSVNKIKIVENGEIEGGSSNSVVVIAEEPYFPDAAAETAINEIILGAEEGETGTCHETYSITDETDMCSAKLIPGYNKGKKLSETIGKDYESGVQIYGKAFRGFSVTADFLGVEFNEKNVVQLHGNGGLFNDGSSVAYDLLSYKTVDHPSLENLRWPVSSSISCIPEREDHIFLGWSGRKNAEAALDPEEYTPRILYAVWRPNYEELYNQTIKVDGTVLNCNTTKNGTAIISKIGKTNKKKIGIPAFVTVGKFQYDVTSIKSRAFKNCKRVTNIIIPDTITQINKNTFIGAKKLKVISFKTKEAIKVKKGAFKGLDTKKIIIKTSQNMGRYEHDDFTKALRKAGFKGEIN